ncbi:MAG TPA: hypothetical protein VFV33_26605 [Gemmatimonadaceae bacterium]|nr:hypothetical protein [Gemmatimonadaceae bacterium]
MRFIVEVVSRSFGPGWAAPSSVGTIEVWSDYCDHTGTPHMYCVAEQGEDGVLRIVDGGYGRVQHLTAKWPELAPASRPAPEG